MVRCILNYWSISETFIAYPQGAKGSKFCSMISYWGFSSNKVRRWLVGGEGTTKDSKDRSDKVSGRM